MQSNAWFALIVRPKHERTAARSLRNQGFEEYVPLYRTRRRWSDRMKELESVLFPGYVFCRFDYQHRLQVLNSPGVCSIAGTGKRPEPVDESELSAVRALVSSGRAIQPWPRVHMGERVTIDDGPLAGLRGVVVRDRDAWRVVITVQALERAVAVEVDRAILSPERNHGSPQA